MKGDYIGELKSVGEDELYVEWFECPECKKNNIIETFNYCPDCGYKIKKDKK